MYQEFGLYIDGKWREASDGTMMDIIDPATEEVLGSVPAAKKTDLQDALKAAKKAEPTWRATSALKRSQILRKAAEHLSDRLEASARIMSYESGKPLEQSRGEFSAAIGYFEWYAEEARRIYGQIIEGPSPRTRMSVHYQPVGIVAAFTAWNFPAVLPIRKIAAAIAAGCPIILKPASECPGSAMVLVQCLHEAGCPPGVINLVTGPSQLISKTLIEAPDVRKISFTGSTDVGKRLLEMAASTVKKVSLELGGHAPVIVCEDADPIIAAETAAAVKFRNAGQVCISPSRFYVHESLQESFSKSFAKSAKALKIGNGLVDGIEIGPLANMRGLSHAQALVDDATSKGADLLAGGSRPAGFNAGYYFEPTVLNNVSENAMIMNEEPFVPVAPISAFGNLEKAIERANDTHFGLAAYVFTKSLSTANMVSEALEAGMVGVNDMLLATPEAPFGGVKESGMGREGGSLGIYDYLEPKYIKTTF